MVLTMTRATSGTDSRMSRPFRAGSPYLCTHGVALGWYATPLRGSAAPNRNRDRVIGIIPVATEVTNYPAFGCHTPAWDQVAMPWRRATLRAAGAAKTAFPRGALERETTRASEGKVRVACDAQSAQRTLQPSLVHHKVETFAF